MTANLATRSFQPELMDGDTWTRDEYVRTLRQLRLLNVLTNGYRPTLGAVAHFAKSRTDGRPMRILDIGFGYGDTLRAIARWAVKRGLALELTGIDLNPLSAEVAVAATAPGLPIRYLTGDVFAHEPARPYDVIINALFMHHMNDEQAVKVLRWMAEHSTAGFFINDLHRHRVAYSFIRHFTRLFGFNRLIRNDAPLSVARSFRAHEWPAYAHRAGLDPARLNVKWHWAFRYGVRYDHR
jgi:2-polyprenyl-3-methyl-5-hydroxy-6-metoxy-1,4-benzoquinol methylase